MWFLPPLLRHPGDKNTNIMLTEMLEIVLTPKILGPPKSGALGLTLFSLMINPRLHIVGQCLIWTIHALALKFLPLKHKSSVRSIGVLSIRQKQQIAIDFLILFQKFTMVSTIRNISPDEINVKLIMWIVKNEISDSEWDPTSFKLNCATSIYATDANRLNATDAIAHLHCYVEYSVQTTQLPQHYTCKTNYFPYTTVPVPVPHERIQLLESENCSRESEMIPTTNSILTQRQVYCW